MHHVPIDISIGAKVNGLLESVTAIRDNPWIPFVGFLVTLVAWVTTIWVAAKAKSAAAAAQQASEDTRRKFSSFDFALNLKEVEGLLLDIRRQVDQDGWQLCAERCLDVQRLVVPIVKSAGELLEVDTIGGLSELIAQIGNLRASADRANHNSGKPPDKIRIHKIIELQLRAVQEVYIDLQNSLQDDINV